MQEEDEQYVQVVYEALQTGKCKDRLVLLRGELNGHKVSIIGLKEIDGSGREYAVPLAVVTTGVILEMVKPL